MTPRDAFADGRLWDALALQDAAVRDHPADPAARLFLAELLAFAGRFADARDHLARIDSDEPGWAAWRRGVRRLLVADRRRSVLVRRPVFVPVPPPAHVRRRWQAVRALRDGRPEDAVRYVDAADEAAPALGGFVDGREFDGLRDADDRFASVLELLVGRDYVWVGWEDVRRVRFGPADGSFHRLYRPAAVRLADGPELVGHAPLLYPRSWPAGGPFATGQATDHVNPDAGPVRCVGAKVLLCGDDEVPLAECAMIEVR